MRSRYWIFIPVLVLILVLVITIRSRTPFGRSNSSFAIDWSEELDIIEIYEGRTTLIIEKIGEEWLVNESFIARKSAIDFILKTVSIIEIKSPVSPELFEELVEDKNATPVQVTLSRGKRSSRYYIYRTPDSAFNNIMRRSLKSKPFFVTLPGYESDPGNHFIADEKFWMPYNIFSLEPDAIKSIDLRFKDPDMDDISIRMGGNDKGVYINGNPLNLFSNESVRRYISYFTFVPFENWAFDLDPDIRSQMLTSDPEIVIELNMDRKIIDARFWSKYNSTPEGLIPDTDRLYGTLNNGKDFFLVRYFDLDPLIKTADYFISD